MKGLAGRKRVFDSPGQDLLQITEDMPVTVQLTASKYHCKENCGSFSCRIVRFGDKVGSCRVRVVTYPTSPQTAVPDKDYKHFNQIVEFSSLQEVAEVQIEIIDDGERPPVRSDLPLLLSSETNAANIPLPCLGLLVSSAQMCLKLMPSLKSIAS
jgi:hypothetical protein